MNRPLISVIIPVYNAALYIEQCIISVLRQTLQSIEVIAVNDGSVDESGVILDRLAVSDERLKVFHSKNKGVSAARNFGLEQAKGSYIGFVDADDWVEPEMFELLHSALEREQADMVICNVSIIQQDGTTSTRLKLEERVVDTTINKANEIEQFMRFRYDNANWNKLFSAQIINDNQIRFDETMFLGEDLLFNLMYIQFSRRMIIVNKNLYNYRVQNESLTNTRKHDSITQFNLLYEQYEVFTKENNAAEEWEVFQQQMAKGCYNHLLNEIAITSKQESTSVLQFLFIYYRNVKKLNPKIFSYQHENLGGIQGLKKKLLMRNLVFPFSLVVVSSIFAKKINKLIST